jgi:hypothetical protein
MHISGPLPGNTHDAKAMHQTGLNELIREDNAIGDKGYIGTGITTPYHKPAAGELLDWQKEFNTSINKIRYVIERAIAHFKTWRMHVHRLPQTRAHLRHNPQRHPRTPLLYTTFRISLNALPSIQPTRLETMDMGLFVSECGVPL